MCNEKATFLSPWIHTTEKCNLKCHYCYVKGNAVMGKKVYEGLENMLSRSSVDNIHLRFAGGEPLLVFDEWKGFAERMLEDSRTTVEVLTNFRYIPKNFFSFADRNRVNISISIDNGKVVKVLDKIIVERLKRLENPWIMTTITNENVNNLDELATFIGMNGYGWAITTDYFEKTIPDWDVLGNTVVRILNILKLFDYDFNNVSFNNFSTKGGFSGCRAGDEMFTVACNGDIYQCQTQIGVGTPVGTVFDGYEKREICQRNYCKSCTIGAFCTGWCPIHYKVPNKVCNVIKIFANQVIKEVTDAK